MKFPVVLATHNPDKAREIFEILKKTTEESLATAEIRDDSRVAAFVVFDASATPPVIKFEHLPDPEETADTLEENAHIKARAWVEATDLPAIADDTGLFVDALDGAPGIYAARYSGPGCSYEDNWRKLLTELGDTEDRSARFETAAVYVDPDGTEALATGVMIGTITTAPRGDKGMGYDPVFVPDGKTRTYAEMSDPEKNEYSHRADAFRALAKILVATF